MDLVKLTAARLRAIDHQPFLGVALYALTTVPAPGLGTFAVDGRWRLFIDPEVLARWRTDEVAGVLLHEVSHVVRDHAGRAAALGVDAPERMRWNVAADAEINDDLLRDRVVLPGSPVTPQRLKLPPGKAAEYYYDRLPPQLPPHHDCGAGCHGTDPNRPIAPTQAVGLDPVEADLVRRQVAEAVLLHARGRVAGSHAGGWERWAEDLLHPTVDWRRVLRGRVRSGLAATSGRVDYSFGRPSRRSTPTVVLPSLRQPRPTVAALVDTSGSVSAEQLSRAWTEVLGCLRAVGVRRDLLRVYAVDTVATRVTGTPRGGVGLVGGGGTDLRVGFDTALRARPQPNLIVVLTDGFTPWPERAVAPTIVVVLGAAAGPARPVVPDWCDVIHVPDDAGAQ